MRCKLCGRAVPKRGKLKVRPDCRIISRVEKKLSRPGVLIGIDLAAGIDSTVIRGAVWGVSNEEDEGVIKKVESKLSGRSPGPSEFRRSKRSRAKP